MESVTTETKQLQTEEIAKLRELQDKYAKITAELGRLGVQSILLEERKKLLSNEYIKTQEDENKFLEQLNSKYGEGVLDIDTGVFTPRK